MAFDFYIKRDSWLHRFDPRVKILLMIVLMVVSLFINSLIPALVLLAAIHLLLLSAQIPKNRFKWVWKMMLPVTIMIILLWPFFYAEGRELISLGVIHITLGGILQGIAMALRICCLGFACFILLFTTDQGHIVRGFVKLGLPYKAGLMIAIALRYLPTFFGIINMVMDAQKARGLDLNSGGLITKLKSYMPIMVAVMITGLKTSDNLSNALETRAFSIAVKKRTYFHDIHMRAADFFAVFVVLAFLAASLYYLIYFG